MHKSCHPPDTPLSKNLVPSANSDIIFSFTRFKKDEYFSTDKYERAFFIIFIPFVKYA